jgi:ElaB/YqjD/DUF883 family membrane-anchored ribosome-binding protein
MESEQVIKHRMEQTRESLIEKIETLENKVMNSVQNATSAVSETVASVKETMHEGVESVKDAVDVKAHVDRHPWLMIGGSIFAGYVLANMLSGGRKPAAEVGPAPPLSSRSLRAPANGRHTEEKPATSTIGSWLGPIEPELEHLKGLAVGAALGAIREMLAEEVPPHMAEQLRMIVDGITKKMGGEPVPTSDFVANKPSTSACAGAEATAGAGARFGSEKPGW